jgi:hypothetical protein
MFTKGFEKTSGIFDKARSLITGLPKTVTNAPPKPLPGPPLPKPPVPPPTAPIKARTPSWVRQAVSTGKMKYVDVK